MSGDYTRLTFRAERGYSSVRLQQGRVQVDADWNEAADIGLHRDRATTRDVVGRTGVPNEAPGFALTAGDPDGAGSATDLLLGFGRAYVDGVLVEHLAPAPTVLSAVSGAPGDFLVQSGPVPRAGQWLIDPADATVAPARVTAVPAPVPADGGLTRVTLSPAPAGTTLTRTIAPSLLAQPDLTGDPVPAEAGLYGLYLEVFEREVTALDDPSLRETALGGPDTCVRTQVVWQVRAAASVTSCKDFSPGWVPDDTARARLTARGVPAVAADDPCLTPDPGGYRGIDNRLYRVEVHRGGDVEGGQALVKWSRDNGIHRTRYTLVSDRLRVESLGRDDATALDQDQWVEVQDEAAWRAGVPGHMVRLGEVNGLEIAIAEIRDPVTNLPLTDADGDPLVAALPPAGLVRRWEGGPPVAVAADAPLALEAGIDVTLGPGRVSPGDWWTIPARTLTAAVEWPEDPANGDALALPAQAVARHYMPLGIVERRADGRLELVSDCRTIFPPLTALVTFEMLGGDGQEAPPNTVPGNERALVPLPAPLRVGVSRGLVPVAGRLVRFTTTDTNPGQLDPVPGTPAGRILRALPTELIVATDADGAAEARFSIHGLRTAYTVEARLLDADEPNRADPVHLPIRFFATADVARETAYDPRNCLYQRQTPGERDPAQTVQDAIDRLCPVIAFVPLGGDGQVALPARPLPAPLRVGLLWGSRPLANVRVSFTVQSGDARVSDAVVATGPDGTAQTQVLAGDNAAADQGIIRVLAQPQGLPQTAWPPDLTFTARFAAGGTATEPGVRIVSVRLATGAPLENDAIVDPRVLASGISITCDRDVFQDSVRNLNGRPNPVCRLTLDLPWPTGADARQVWTVPAPGFVGFETITLAADVNADDRLIVWQPMSQPFNVRQWLMESLPRALEAQTRGAVPRVLARLTLKGNFIWAQDDPGVFLDGDAFGVRAGNRTAVRLPSGDSRRGGDFEMWFWVGTTAGILTDPTRPSGAGPVPAPRQPDREQPPPEPPDREPRRAPRRRGG